jgi:hypothetical protein
VTTKDDLLREAGYRYNFDRMVWINRQTRKVFSVEAVADNPEEWLTHKIHERTDGDWHFYFNDAPSASIVKQLVAELDGRHAIR